MKNRRKYFLAGIFFLLLQCLVIFRNIISDYNNYFWFCDFVCVPLAIGFFIRKDYIIKGLINIGFIPQLIYIGFLGYAFTTGVSLITTIPENITLFYLISSLLIHLSTTFALILTYDKKLETKTLFSSLMFLFVMYVIALFFTAPGQGANYVLSAKTLIPWPIPHYTQLWIILTFVLVVLPTQLIQYIIYKKSLLGISNSNDKTRNHNAHNVHS